MATKKEVEFETDAMKEIKMKYSVELLNELETKNPTKELYEHLPYIKEKKNIRRVMVAIHELEYQIPKSCNSKSIQTKMVGCEKKESEVENNESDDSPPVEGKSKVRTSKVKEPNESVSKKKANHAHKCLLCTYHCETMLERKYSKPGAAEESTPACQESNVIFLLYCINCDDVFLGYTARKLNFLMNVNFGFDRDEKCQPGKSHEKRYLRCMIIDKIKVQLKEEIPFSICTLIDVVQNKLRAYSTHEINKKMNVKKIRKPHPGKKEFKIETPNYLKTWDSVLQLKKYLNIQIHNEEHSDKKRSPPPVIDLTNKFGVYRKYHYVQSSQIKELGPNPKIFLYDSENIVYLIICHNCEVKYVGKTKGSFPYRYGDFLTNATPHVKSHFQSGKCTIRDMQFTVIDALSDDQNYFLQTWRYFYNKCEPHAKKIIWGIMNTESEWTLQCKKLLMKSVLCNKSPMNVFNTYIEKKLSEISEKDLNYDLEFWNVAGDELELFLRSENENWIKNTKSLFLEDKESFWIQKLDTLKNGLNQTKGSKSKDTFPNFYDILFKSISK